MLLRKILPGPWFVAGAAVTIIASLMEGCVFSQNVYLQDATVSGPMRQSPVWLTDSVKAGDFRISPRLSWSNQTGIDGRIPGHSQVNAKGVFQVDTIRNNGVVSIKETDGVNIYPFEGRNLHWQMPAKSFGLDVDYAVTNHFALTGGLTYAQSDQEGYWGGNVGVGLFFQGKAVGFRLDGGVQWSSLSYVASTTVVTEVGTVFSSETSTRFYKDEGKESHNGVYLSITMNTAFDKSPANVFVSFSLSRQTLIDFTPYRSSSSLPLASGASALDNAEYVANLVSVAPGVSFRPSEEITILAGVRFIADSELNIGTPSQVVAPFVQVGFLF